MWHFGRNENGSSEGTVFPDPKNLSAGAHQAGTLASQGQGRTCQDHVT
jgi:hypothetical protein